MGKPYGRLGPFLFVAACAAALGGCKQEFSDQAFGVLDLASVYDGGSSQDPSSGVPQQIDPTLGFVDGKKAEYYDFGVIPVKRDPVTNEPRAALVQPMYFFFNAAGQPLFSTPARETRNGTDWMKGGKGVLNPNPRDYCAGVSGDQTACMKLNDAEKKKPYAVRTRDPWIDPQRQVADYQRPIVDVSPADRSSSATVNQYTGLWEIVAVTVTDSSYVPDAIKHAATLQRAVDHGHASMRSTGKVINCPIIDERTLVTRGVADPTTPRPVIELWYRRQLAFCFLANGWETLGNDKNQLFFGDPGSDEQRVDTFDVDRIVVGQAGDPKGTRLVVPISKAYVPVIETSDQSGNLPVRTGVVENLLTRGIPKHFRNNPPGYSPIRWMWNFTVSNDYVSGNLTSVDQLDPSVADTTGQVRNIALRGLQIPCGYAKDPKFNNQCGREVKDPMDPAMMILDPTGDPVCTKLGLECNPDSCFCDAPFVGYAQPCGPAIAQCSHKADALSPNGYTCLFPSGGNCYIRCNPRDRNDHATDNMGKKPVEQLDSRCGSVPGYHCFGYLDAGICLKSCDTESSDVNQCASSTMAGAMTQDLGKGQICQDFGVEVCSWPDGYMP